jgi:acetyl esterase
MPGGCCAPELPRSCMSSPAPATAGTCHGFDSLLPDWEVTEQLFALQGRALQRAFYGTARPS